MTFGKEFVTLNKKIHDRASFDCGEPELNLFLQTKAAKHMQIGISKTLVMSVITAKDKVKSPICSYYTISPSSIKRQTLPKNIGKKFPHYPVPVFLIAQLAVDKNYQGQKLGRITLVKALEYLWCVNAEMPAYAVIVDCLTDDLIKFYTKFGFQVLERKNNKTRLFLPMKTVAALFT
ncbi:MAG: GNAT family N-acetyltransferase [Proteobacteria bacterium]|nr:GNAT family N-acetyltransferase [Pseudomonadota bacterium]